MTSPMTNRRHRNVRTALAAACLVPAWLTACSDDDPAPTAAPSGDSAMGATSTTDLLDQEGVTLGCASLPPGEPMSRQQATVRFQPEQVCPGYVTVVLGTPVGFVNEGPDPSSLRVFAAEATGQEGEVLIDREVAPGEVIDQDFDQPGIYGYETDALPSFRGTVEVQAPDTADASG